MSIKYALYENYINNRPGTFAARVQFSGTANLEALAQRILDQGTTVTKPDILAVLENMIKASEGYLLDGFRVNLGGLCELFPRVRGVFEGITDSFDPVRHQVILGANPGGRIRTAFRDKAAVVRVETRKPTPTLLTFVDLADGSTNDVVTPGNIGTINGRRLSFDPAQSDEGIFFIHADNQAEYKVADVQRNKPRQLVFLVPTLPGSGHYYLEVRCRFGTELRSGRLAAVLNNVQT